MKAIKIEYRFKMESEDIDLFQIVLDPNSLQTTNIAPDPAPEWTALDFFQCPNCPLDAAESPRCPAALNMVPLVRRFDRLLSYDETMVIVVAEERYVYNKTTVQRGVCSLMGLLMATSGCPLTAFFKPMARFHLPFASTEETIWRATSSYLLAQYFRCQANRVADTTFHGLSDLYDKIQIVNMAFAKRLRSTCKHDSMVNAIILLDMFAKSMPTAIEDSLDEIRYLFEPYLSHSQKQS
ncbi:MAG: hypothetical protein HKP58_14860 [Desulfatitalea sp.]|nr:hypothetical protein [Desulfatitalea sp.]NNK01688.1 hypothetical protein [Desulfatitalea sp.]